MSEPHTAELAEMIGGKGTLFKVSNKTGKTFPMRTVMVVHRRQRATLIDLMVAKDFCLQLKSSRHQRLALAASPAQRCIQVFSVLQLQLSLLS